MFTVNLEVAPTVIEVGLKACVAELKVPHAVDEKPIVANKIIHPKALIPDKPCLSGNAIYLANKQDMGWVLFELSNVTSSHRISCMVMAAPLHEMGSACGTGKVAKRTVTSTFACANAEIAMGCPQFLWISLCTAPEQTSIRHDLQGFSATAQKVGTPTRRRKKSAPIT
jgi:hypothetical protein